MRQTWIAVLVLLVAGATVWLLEGESDPGAELDRTEGPPADAGREDAPALEAAGKKPPPKAEPTAANKFAGVTNWAKLGRGLWLNAERPAAVERAVELLRGHPERMRELIRRLHPRHDMKRHAGRSIQTGVAWTMIRLGDPALDVLVEELGDDNAAYRTRVAAVIGSFRDKAGRAVPALLEYLDRIEEDPPGGEAASLVHALAWIGPPAKDLLPQLERWLDEGARSEEIEVAAIQALAQIGGPTDALFTRFREVLRADGWPRQRGAVLHQLKRLGKDAAPMIPFLMELSEEGVLRESDAMLTLADMGVPDPRLIAQAEERLRALPMRGESLGIYAHVLARLGEKPRRKLVEIARKKGPLALAGLTNPLKQAGVEHREILRVIRPAFDADAVETRRVAWFGLTELDGLAGKDVEHLVLQGLQEQDANLRLIAVGTAGYKVPITKPVLAALLGRLEDPKEGVELRSEAAAILIKDKARCTERLFNAILAFHRQHPDAGACFYLRPYIRSHTAVVLKLWVEDAKRRPRAAPLYWDGLQDLPRIVRERHAEELRALGVDPKTGGLIRNRR